MESDTLPAPRIMVLTVLARAPELWWRAENVARASGLHEGTTTETLLWLEAIGLAESQYRIFDDTSIETTTYQITEAGRKTLEGTVL